MASETKKNVRVKLFNVRSSYLHVFKKHAYEDNEPKFSGTFLIDPKTKDGKENIAAMEDAIADVEDAMFKGKRPKEVYCLMDGDEDKPEQDGMMVVKASNYNRPKVLDRDKEPLVEEDGKPYSGCYVNVILDVYGMSKHKSIQATLMGVQFVDDGEPFGGGYLDDDEFDEVEGNARGRDKDKGKSRRSRDDDDEKPARRSRSRDDDDEEKPSRRSRSRDDDDEKPARSRRSRDDEDDEKPARRRSRDDDDEPPARSRKRDDDDEPRSRRSRDDDDEPRSRRSRDDDDGEEEGRRPRRRRDLTE